MPIVILLRTFEVRKIGLSVPMVFMLIMKEAYSNIDRYYKISMGII